MGKYTIEFYDFEKNVGLGNCNSIQYTNKKNAIKDAKYIYNSLCLNDKKHISIIVNKYDKKFDEFVCIYEVKIK